MPRLLAAVLALFLGVSSSEAGAWLQPEGKAYLRLSGGWLETRERYDKNGDVIPFDDSGGFRKTTYRDAESILYGEVGLTWDVTVLGAMIFKSLRATQEAAVFKAEGTADGMLGVKAKLWRGWWHVGSVSAEWWFPTGYDETLYPSLGSGTHGLRGGLHGGVSGHGWWSNVDLHYMLREEPFRDQFHGTFSAGARLSRTLALRGTVGAHTPLGEEGTQSSLLLFDPATVDAFQVDVSGVVSLDLGQIDLECELRSVVNGENTLKGTRVSFAVATSPRVRLWGGGS